MAGRIEEAQTISEQLDNMDEEKNLEFKGSAEAADDKGQTTDEEQQLIVLDTERTTLAAAQTAGTMTPEQQARFDALTGDERKILDAAKTAGTITPKLEERLNTLIAAEEKKKSESQQQQQQQQQQPTAEEKKKQEELQQQQQQAQNIVVPKELLTVFPEAKAITDVVEAIESLREDILTERKGTKVLNDLLVENPLLTDLLKDVRSGENIFTAMRKIFDLEADQKIPTAAEDPAKFEEMTRKKIARETAEKTAKERKEAEAAAYKAANEKAAADLAEFAKKNSMTDDQAKKFRDDVSLFIYGDPKTKMLPAKFFETMYAALNYEKMLKQSADEKKKAEEEAALKGKNAGIDATKTAQRQTGDGLPGKSGKTVPLPSNTHGNLLSLVQDESRIFGPK